MPSTNAIHTSDRLSYRTCRLRWHFSSPIRLNLQPRKSKHYLTFGSAIHKGLEAYYEPSSPRSLDLAQVAFRGYLDDWRKSLGQMDPEDEVEYTEALATGLAVLEHYASWAATEDDFEVVWVEKEFQVSIPGLEIPYAFKPDGLLIDKHGRYWIDERKTNDKMPTNLDWLLMDDQPGSYIWGVQTALDIKIEGVQYTFIRSKAPQPLRELKSGLLSLDKRVDTTYEYAIKQIRDHYNEVPSDYADLLQHLKDKGNTFFMREKVRRNANEIANLERSIIVEAQEMTSDPNIYRNPSRINCGSCPFVAPCIATYEGGDVQTLLGSGYHVREG